VSSANDAVAELPPLQKPAITASQLLHYAGASGDFNRIHIDRDYALAAGHPALVVHGMLTNAFVAEMLTRWAGAGSIRRLQLRFVGIAYEGDEITCRGRVIGDEDGVTRVEVSAERRDGRAIATGLAWIARNASSTAKPSTDAPPR
jgi:acyl dehydratase